MLWLPLLLLLLAGLGFAGWMAMREGNPQLPAATPFASVELDPLIDGEGLGNGAAALESWSDERWQRLEQATANLPSVAASAATIRRAGAPGAEAVASATRPKRQGRSTVSTFGSLDRNGDGRLSPAEFAVFHVPGVQPARQGTKADDMPPYVSTNALNRSIGAFRRLAATQGEAAANRIHEA